MKSRTREETKRKWVELPQPPKSEIPALNKQYRGRTKYVVDESLGVKVAQVLSSLGYKATFAPDVGLGGHSDHDVFAYAWSEKRALLTHDADFLNDAEFPFTRNPVVVVLPGAEGDERALIRAIASVVGLLGTYGKLFANSKITISQENIWTVRQHDKSEGRVMTRYYKFAPGRVWQLEETAS